MSKLSGVKPTFVNGSQVSDPDPGSCSIRGIWRAGAAFHTGVTHEVALAQPADAAGSPRWDYVIRRSIIDDFEGKRQIQNFHAAATAARHPNLIAVLDASPTSARPYLVMPRLEGQTLDRILAAGSRPLPVMLWMTRQVAAALAALHAAGWVHGDVKPGNLMVAPLGHVTLIDLGFATRKFTTRQSCYRGTPAYAAPESRDDSLAVVPAMDIYSLGRMLWELLTRADDTTASRLDPVATLIEAMIDGDPTARPTAADVEATLLSLEIRTLGGHITPLGDVRQAA